MEEQSSSKLLAALAKGDTQAFDILYERYAAPLYKFLLLYLRNEDLAQEMLQNVFLKAFKFPEKIARAKNPTSYLMRMARNEANDYLRRKKFEKKALQKIPLGKLIIFQDMQGPEQQELNEQLTIALENLQDEQREPIFLRIHSKLSFEQMGAVMNCTAAMARYHYEKAVTILKKEMNP